MNAFLAMYTHTLKGIWRERWPYLVLPLMLAGFLVTRLVAGFTLGRDRVAMLDFGLLLISGMGVLSTLYMVHFNWSKELEGPSAAFYLSRPLSRIQYGLARFLAMATISGFVLFSGGLVLMIAARVTQVTVGVEVFQAVYGMFLINLVLLSFGTMTAHMSAPLLGLMVSLFFYVAAMLSNAAVDYFESRKQTSMALHMTDPMEGTYGFLATLVKLFVPQLGRLNFKELVVLDGLAPHVDIPFFALTLYALTFTGIFLAWGLHLFEKREFP